MRSYPCSCSPLMLLLIVPFCWAHQLLWSVDPFAYFFYPLVFADTVQIVCLGMVLLVLGIWWGRSNLTVFESRELVGESSVTRQPLVAALSNSFYALCSCAVLYAAAACLVAYAVNSIHVFSSAYVVDMLVTW